VRLATRGGGPVLYSGSAWQAVCHLVMPNDLARNARLAITSTSSDSDVFGRRELHRVRHGSAIVCAELKSQPCRRPPLTAQQRRRGAVAAGTGAGDAAGAAQARARHADNGNDGREQALLPAVPLLQ